MSYSFVIFLSVSAYLVNAAPLIPLNGSGAGVQSGDNPFNISQLDMVDMLFGEKGIINQLVQETLKKMSPAQYDLISQYVDLGNKPAPETAEQQSTHSPRIQPVQTIHTSNTALRPSEDREAQVLINTIWQFLRHSQYGHPQFEELPPLGACDQHKCAEIYQQLNELRRSQVFLDLQTFFALMQDEEGLKLIADLINDPKALEAIQLPLSTTTSSPNSLVDHDLTGVQPKDVLMKLWNREDTTFSFSLDDQQPVGHTSAISAPVISSNLDDYSTYPDYGVQTQMRPDQKIQRVPQTVFRVPKVEDVIREEFNDSTAVDAELKQIFAQFRSGTKPNMGHHMDHQMDHHMDTSRIQSLTTTLPTTTTQYLDIYYEMYNN